MLTMIKDKHQEIKNEIRDDLMASELTTSAWIQYPTAIQQHQ